VDPVGATAKWTAVQSVRAAQGKQRKTKKKRDRGQGCGKRTPRDGRHDIRPHCQSHGSEAEAVAVGKQSDADALDELDGMTVAVAVTMR
jgi:hypothetical protein